MKIQNVDITSMAYPDLLRQIPDPPKRLYCLGNLELLLSSRVAIVGTRRASSYGTGQAFKIAKELSEQGACVVSGLAFGVDAAAHRGALEGPGGTMAVLAQALDQVSPPAHRSLAREILEKGGLLLSEKPVGENFYKVEYLLRNRLIAGLCKATILVEAPYKSGAMNTAKHCKDYHRELWVVPARLTDENSFGGFMWLKDGANLLIDADQLEKNLGLEWKRKNAVKLDGFTRVLYEALRKEPRSVGELCEDFKEELVELYGGLGELELRRLIRMNADHRYSAS